MDGYSWFTLLTLVVTVMAVWMTHRREGHSYSTLDTSCVILNAVLIVMIYPPLSVGSALLGIDRFATEPFSIFLEGTAIAMGRLMPAVSVVGIGASIILRRKEKTGLSFLVQFAGILWFCLTMLLAKLSGSY